MTVRISKPALNVREELSKLNKPSGVAGEAMLRAETPQEQFNLIGAGRKNILINGDFRIAQRGTTMPSYVATNGTYHTVDRWAGWGSSGSYKFEQHVTNTSDLESVNGCQNYVKFSIATGHDNTGIRQYIEDVRTVPSNSILSLSFYIKGTPGRVVETLIQYNYGSGGSPQVDIADSSQLVTLTGNWQYVTLQATGADHSGKVVGSNSNIRVQFKQPDGDTNSSAWEFDLTGVQLELGSVATPFEYRSYGEELALCQRYYYKSSSAHDYAHPLTQNTHAYNSSFITFPVTMRANPTITYSYGGTLIVAPNTTAPSIHGVYFQWNGYSNHFFQITALTADAEL